MSINIIKKLSLVFLVAGAGILVAFAGAQHSHALTDEQYRTYSDADIYFYSDDCVGGGANGACGNSAKEIYWSILSKYTDDPIKLAGILGNLINEGGMNPVAWEGYPSLGNGGVNGSGELVGGWDAYYNGTIIKTGVGAFGLTSGLDKYLHTVNDEAPDLVKYFKDTKGYSYNFLYHPDCGIDDSHSSYGDCLLEKIGPAEFGKLVEFEIEYALGPEFKPGATQEYLETKFSTPSEAAYWWMDVWEVPGYRNPEDRKRDAEAAYKELKDFKCSDAEGGSCQKLSELRTKMWTEASQKDREDFMYTVSHENYSIAGVEGYMNQVISKHGTNGSLSDWLDHQCPAFRGGVSCRGSHTINDKEQDWINQALNGSNNIKYAIGNATGGSNVGAGKIVCVWDGTKCRDDVDYSKEGGTGACSVYSPSADFGECWGLEGEDSWAEEMAKDCGSSPASTAASSGSSSSSSSTSSSSSSSNSVSGSDITWIGDSDSALAHDEEGYDLVERTFPGVDYGPSFNQDGSYIQSGKFINQNVGGNRSGLNILEEIVQKDELRPYLVFAMGGNGGWTEGEMEDFLKLIDGKDVKVIITTTKYKNVEFTEGNEIARKTAEKYPNIYLADIAANYKDEYFTESDIEFNAEGGKMFVNTIKQTLEQISSGGCVTGEFVWYPQYTGEYSNIEVEVKTSTDSPAKVKTTMGEIGCGPFAFAMMANMLLPQEITPVDTMKVAIDTDSIVLGGSIGSVLTKNLAEHYGMAWEKIDSSSTEAAINDINKHLKEGWMIETAGSGSTPYTSGGHYVGIRGIDSSGKWLLADPGHSEDISQQPWNPKDVVSAGMNIDNVYAFRTTGSTSCDVNMCKGDNGVGTGVEATKPIGPIHEDSANIPCDPRTKDLGVRDDAYYNNQRYSIRLCSIPNIKMTGTQGDDGDDGYVHVNSRVSGAFYSLSEEHNKRCGNYLEAVDDYRTNAEQTALYNAYLNGTGNLAAAPGSQFANHQGGLAIDFNTSTYCSSDSSVASGPNGWFEPDFLANFGLQDGRRFSSPENWHVDALED